MPSVLCICLSPTIQRTVTFDYLHINSVNRCRQYRQDASGKAVNSARVLNQLEPGCAVAVCPLGKTNAALFMELAERDKIAVIPVETPGSTRECWTLLDRAQGTTTELVADEPADKYDFSDAQAEMLAEIETNIEKCDAVLIAGSCPKYFSDGLPAVIAKMASDKGKFLLADYCGENLQKTLALCTPAVIKINEEEFCSTFGFDLFITEEQLKNAVAEKSRTLGCIIVVTRGKKSTFAAENGAFVEFNSEKVRAVNTTACGDSFSAGFMHEYLRSHNLAESLAKGTWCAARNAESEVPGSVKAI